MRSTFHGLEVAKRGLYAQQTSISTTGHNIANANTLGYTRQKVDLTASLPIETPGMNRSQQPGQLGTGVDVQSITRIREGFLDEQFRNESSLLGGWEIKSDTLEKIELLFNEPNDNALSTVIDQFYDAWQDLSTDPTNATARAVVSERSLAMLDGFKHLDKQLTQLQKDLDVKLNAKIDGANLNIEQISHLNKEIARIEGLGHNANDLRDKRDVLVDDLSKIMSLSVKEDKNGMYDINLTDGTKLVSGKDFFEVGTVVPLSSANGGEIEAIQQSKDVIVEEYKQHINSMLQGMISGKVSVNIPEGSILAKDVTYVNASGVSQTLTSGTPVPSGGIKAEVNGINGVHELGWTLRQDGANAKSGEPFFVLNNMTGAFNIQDLGVNQNILKDVGLIATSFKMENTPTGTKTLVGNSDLATVLGQLKHSSFSYNATPLTPATSGSFSERLRSIIGGLGVKSQEASRQVDNQEVLLNSVENRRQSVSGVSLDEEMSNLIKFQHAYNASARMMTAQDELLETVINRMGRVGI